MSIISIKSDNYVKLQKYNKIYNMLLKLTF